MKVTELKLTQYFWSFLISTLVLSQSACKIFNNQTDNDENITVEPVRVIVDSKSITPQQWSDLSETQRRDLENRLILIDNWISDSNTWFIPFAAHYIPDINSEGQKRLEIVFNEDPLIKVLNQRDIAINLISDDWTATPDPLTVPLRRTLLRTVLKKNIPAIQTDKAVSEMAALKNKYLQTLFFSGVPAYVSSFGTRVDNTPLLQSLLGEREQVEEQFEVLRKSLRIDLTRSEAPEAPATVNSALDQIGIWICHRVESTLGSDVFIKAIDGGPEKLYEKYLATNPGIFMSLETVPVEVLPLPGQSITH